MMTVLCIILGYLLGSIPFALVIGKLFYKTDIRQYGSGNLGGTNAGRVLGKESWYFGYRSRCLKSCLSCRSCILGQ